MFNKKMFVICCSIILAIYATSLDDRTETVEDRTETVEDRTETVEDRTETVEDRATIVDDQTGKGKLLIRASMTKSNTNLINKFWLSE